MNKDQTSGNWKQFTGKIKEQWGKLTDDDLTVVEGKRDQLIGKLQERYGYGKDVAETEVKNWEIRNKFRW
ncbi:CsbD family protein [Acerihabitans sp. TG2]|uniref:CsbD family protein n=1 Tax=Acerihabitans sp. TG2 TaxID=3096008 RepID=UPI002B227B3B|nr:CsbD family protein [Acerihabitans sp. TG2]MEA9393005.1 CsbD family protein [Acerihabitans sp. TG2]